MKRYGQRTGPTGPELASARKAAGLSQTALAGKAGVSRDSVSYWECKQSVDPKSWAVKRMAEVEPRIADLIQATFRDTRGREMGSIDGTNLRQSGPIRTRANMGLSPVSSMQENARPNARAENSSNSLDDMLEQLVARELARLREREAERKARARVRCEAKTTRKGTPCRNKSEPGKRRCKHHGGMSTGPRTQEGKARIAEAQRARWARWRADRIEAENTVGNGADAVT